MTDKFPMHPDFPLDQAYLDKAAKHGFGTAAAREQFEGFKAYWIERGTARTPRGWLQCWGNRMESQARHRAACNGLPRNRFERKPDSDRLPSRPAMIWIGGRGFTGADIIALKHKAASRRSLDPEEQAALRKWETET